MRGNFEPAGRLAHNLGAKDDSRTQANGVAQAYLQASGYGGAAAEPNCIHHAFIENRGQNPAMGDANKPLKALGNDVGGSHPRNPLPLELEVEAVRVVFAADETAVIILELHGMTSGMICTHCCVSHLSRSR